MSWLSEIVWAILFVLVVGWEITTVLLERRHKEFEPLTRVYRDKLMRAKKFGIIFRLAFITLFGWWLLHWLTPLDW